MGAEEIDLSVELLDVDALDTGKHRTVVVVDPANRRNIKGFLLTSQLQAEIAHGFIMVGGHIY